MGSCVALKMPASPKSSLAADAVLLVYHASTCSCISQSLHASQRNHYAMYAHAVLLHPVCGTQQIRAAISRHRKVALHDREACIARNARKTSDCVACYWVRQDKLRCSYPCGKKTVGLSWACVYCVMV